jgi:hypothetical protein
LVVVVGFLVVVVVGFLVVVVDFLVVVGPLVVDITTGCLVVFFSRSSSS